MITLPKLSDEAKRVLARGIRGFITGAIASTVIGLPTVIKNWQELWAWTGSLLLAFIVGGITGGLLAIDKYLRDIKAAGLIKKP